MIVQQTAEIPELTALFKGVRDKLRLSLAMAIVGAELLEPTPLDDLFERLVADRTPKARAQARRRISRILRSPADTRQVVFGRYGGVEATDYHGSEHAERLVGHDAPDDARVRRAIGYFEREAPLDIEDSTASAGVRSERLGLFLNAVRCVDGTATGCETFAMIGSATDAAGAVRRIPGVTIAENFEAGETRRFAGKGRLLHEWALGARTGQPGVCAAVLCAVEDDDEGFAGLLTELWDQVSDEIAHSVAGRALVGARREALCPVAGWLIDGLLDWSNGLFEDHPTVCATVVRGLGRRPGSPQDWTLLAAGPPHTFSVNYDGRYQVWCSLDACP